MKILLVSDTHKKNENYFIVLKQVKPDMVIHCGDGEGCEYALTEAADCPVERGICAFCKIFQKISKNI